jgi:hypothetical protein
VERECCVVHRLKGRLDSLLALKEGSVHTDMVISFGVYLGQLQVLRVDVLAR